MNVSRVDHIIQYALALASQSDEWEERQLGPIHFIKYVYLADLAFATRKQESFTGVTWLFHKFGPWSNDVYQRLDSALDAIGAQKKLIPMQFKDEEFTRWSVSDRDLAEELEKNLPLSICGAVRKSVRSFANDTPSLLDHVYKTLPMLTAAPGEELNLFVEIPRDVAEVEQAAETLIVEEQISNNEVRRRKARLKEIKVKVNERITERIKRKDATRRATPKPEYDEVFSRGVEWLDSLAGQPIEETEGVAEIAPTVWKSKARFNPDVS